jgi:hypothetical protein
MSRTRYAVAAVVATTLGLASPGMAAQPAAPHRLAPPIYGEAKVQVTKPNTKVVGNEVVTTIMVKNIETAPIAGFQVEEYWYDVAGNPLGGGTYRHPKPLQPGEVIQVTLKTPKSPKLNRNQCGFSHAHGAIKKTIVAKLEVPKPGK